MHTGIFCMIVVAVICLLQGSSLAQNQCKRTNKKPYRYCVDNVCKTDRDCKKNEKCLCDGDCGLSCIENGLKCRALSTPRNAIARISIARKPGTEFQRTISYKCKKGYTLRGSKKRTCRGIGTWDGKNVRCRMLCKDPGDIKFGNKDKEKSYYKVDSVVNYWCFPGYNLKGNKRLRCTKSGSWSSPPPTCNLPTCSKPKIPPNAEVARGKLKEKYRYNQYVVYKCGYGYFTAGSRGQRCLQGGKWSRLTLRCIPKSCGDPGTPKNGRRRGLVLTFEKKVYYECDRGFILIGPKFRQCQSDQSWSDSTPTCEPVDCGRLPTPLNGEKIEETKTTFEGRVRFQCKKIGYELTGSSQRVCGEDGKWDGTLTKCKPVECKDPGKPNFGGRNPDDLPKYVFEDKITYQCKTNHTLYGQEVIICHADKSWSNKVPKCLQPCMDPGIPKGGRRHHHSFLHGQKVSFSCKKRWKMEGEETITCNDGKWVKDAPKCLEGCAKPTHSSNGWVRPHKDIYVNGEKVQMYCHGDFVLDGAQSRTCQNGKWNKDQTSCKRKCSNPGSPYNGWASGREYFEGKQVRFYCNRDYDLIGARTIQCLSTGRWSEIEPECKERCQYRRPSNSYSTPNTADGQKVKHGTTIRHSCERDYTLVGEEVITCNNGRWNPNIPSCKAPCNDPGLIENGYQISASFKHRGSVRYACDKGYSLVGASQLMCNNGRWSGSNPSCKKNCGDPGTPNKGERKGSNFKHGKSVSYSCKRGTQLVGDWKATCSNGRWSSAVPQCLVACLNPGRPYNGEASGREYIEGKQVTFYCNHDYDLIGERAIRCLSTGQWSNDVPECKKRCQYRRPLNIRTTTPNTADGEKVKHGTTIRHACERDYTLVGDEVITCENGRWNSDIPSCKAPCKDPGRIENGYHNSFQFRHQDTVIYRCDKSFSLDGEAKSICNDGQWSTSKPSCKKSCVDPGTPINGGRNGNDFKHGKRVTYSCKSGTQRVGDRKATCTNGRWSSPVPQCLVICKAPKRPANGDAKLYREPPLSGDNVTFSCDPNYDMIGNIVIICNDGTWSGISPRCVGRCKIPLNNLQTSIPLKSGKYLKDGTKITFSCKKGQQLDGVKKVRCQDGQWSNSFPICRVPCKEPESVRGGRQNGNEFKYEFECNPGYKIRGSSVINCRVDGIWDNNPPQCLKNCKDIGDIKNAIITKPSKSVFEDGDRISIICNDGYRIKGPLGLQCRDGKWSEKVLPICVGVCRLLNRPVDGEMLDFNFDYGATVRFRCKYGYSMRGNSKLTCNNGNWSHKEPVCKANCNNPGTPINGQRQGDLFTHLQTVTFSCNDNFLMIGPSEIQCINGKWNAETPICTECGSPLGMKNGDIPDKNIKASSRWSWNRRASYARLNGQRAWCSGLLNRKPYLEIDLVKPYKITYLATQGSAKDGKWATKYIVSHTLASSSFIEYREQGKEKLFNGNIDEATVVKHKLKEPFIAKKIRFQPLGLLFFGHLFDRACMRVEIYGCNLPTDCILAGSRVLGRWSSNYYGGYMYFRSYVKTIEKNYNEAQLEIEDRNHHGLYFKTVSLENIVLDVPNKQLNLPQRTRVLAPWDNRYYTATIISESTYYYLVETDFIDWKTNQPLSKWFPKKDIRVLKPTTLCK